MSEFYEGMQSTAERLLKQFGQPVKITRGGSLVGNAFGVMGKLSQSVDSKGGMQTVVNTLNLKLSALKKAPQVGDVCIVGKEKFLIRAMDTTRPTDTTLIYNLELVPHG